MESNTHIEVLVNADAGTVIDIGAERFCLECREAFGDAGVSCKLQCVAAAEFGSALELAVARMPAILVVVGGDGTIRAAAARVSETDIALGIIPLGTLNLLARDYEIPQEIEAAVRTIALGCYRMIDVMEVNGERFCHCSVLGVYPHIVRMRDYLGYVNKRDKYLKMMRAAIKVFYSFPRYRLFIKSGEPECAEVREILRTSLAAISTDEMVLTNGVISRKSIANDACLTFTAVRGLTPGKVLKAIFAKSLGLELSPEDAAIWRSERFSISSTRKRKIRVTLDGELRSLSVPLEYRVLPKALRLIVPEHLAENVTSSSDA